MFTRKTIPDYAVKCLDAAQKCFSWSSIAREKQESTPEVYGTAILASIELFKATKKDFYKQYAVQQAAKLKQLQAEKTAGELSGFFYSSENNSEPYRQVLGSSEFIAICSLAEEFPLHTDLKIWKTIIENYVNNYLLALASRNSFNLVLFGVFSKDPGGNRTAGKYWYRYFMQPELNWWVGINANAASAAIGLIKASALLHNKSLLSLAQRELDWICGSNPFNSSTIVGCGNNQPPAYQTTSFVPGIPAITGAVMNGIGGDHNDQPFKGDGIWQVSEYWTPMVATTLWLIKEVEKNIR